MCTVKDCKSVAHSRGYCNMHYKRWKKFGNPEMTKALLKIVDGKKWCDACHRQLPLEQFHKSGISGLLNICGRCANLKRYGITTLDYERMLEEQEGVCAICKSDHPGPKGVFMVDHDHSCCAHEKRYKCGSCNRGLLCASCNTGIGHLQESEEIMLSAIAYLKR